MRKLSVVIVTLNNEREYQPTQISKDHAWGRWSRLIARRSTAAGRCREGETAKFRILPGRVHLYDLQNDIGERSRKAGGVEGLFTA